MMAAGLADCPPRSRSIEKLIVWFHDPECRAPSMAGGKGANLARLTAAGFRVPPGFCVTVHGYRAFAGGDGPHSSLIARLSSAAPPADHAAAARDLRGYLLERPIPDTVASAVAAAYGEMGGGPVAVRSSATAEDLAEASFAGQQDTFLNVRGLGALMERVRDCWISLWTDRAVAYRVEHAYTGDVALAVVVQGMVEASAAGVLFTANPVSLRRDEQLVNAAHGLGEAVVGGRVNPDTFLVRDGKGIASRAVGRKEVEVVYDDTEVTERPVPADRALEPALSDRQVVELAEVGRRVEALYGRPQDIEWAFADGHLHILQSRPITTIGPPAQADPADHWTRALVVEILPDAPCPAFNSVLEPVFSHMLEFTFGAWGLKAPRGVPACRIFYSQPYLNLRYIREALRPLPDGPRERLTQRLADPFSAHPRGQSRAGAAGLLFALRMFLAARRVRHELPGVVDDYRRQLATLTPVEPQALSEQELARRISAICGEAIPPIIAWDFLLIASLGFVHGLLEACVAASGVADPQDTSAALMSGVTGNVTMATNKALWNLGQVAAARPAVATVLTDGRVDKAAGNEFLQGLKLVEGGPEFVAALESFLAEFGHREVRMDIVYPTWGEDPSPVLGFVGSYLKAGAPDPAEQEERLTRRRYVAAEAVRTGLGARGWRGRLLGRMFDWSFTYAEELGGLRDTMHFHVTESFPPLRRMLATLGERWVDAGRLTSPDDVYCLRLPRIVEAATEPGDLRSEALAARRGWERRRSGPWPTAIVDGREVYDDAVDATDAVEGALHGVPGSPGVATGPARIIRRPEDFGRLGRGEVLVAPYTNPAWTPLFAVAGALVAATGGVLSHGAIVAREYGIPAVMGVAGATERLIDGEGTVVDGTRGTVTRTNDATTPEEEQ